MVLKSGLGVLYVIYGSRCGGQVADKARGVAKCFYHAMRHHTECVTEEQQSIAAKGVIPVNTKVATD